VALENVWDYPLRVGDTLSSTGRAVGLTPPRMADRCDASGVVKPRFSCLPGGPNDASYEHSYIMLKPLGVASRQPDDRAQHACRKDARRGQRLFLVRPVLMRLARSSAHVSRRRESRRRIPSASGHVLTCWINRSVIAARRPRRCMGSTCRCDRVGAQGRKASNTSRWNGWHRSQSISRSTLTRRSRRWSTLRPHSERCTRAMIGGWPATQRSFLSGARRRLTTALLA
jgi:hypothetical protein